MQVVAQLTIKVHASGALSVEGPVADARWCLDVLDHARDAIKNQQRRRDEIIVPARDVSLT